MKTIKVHVLADPNSENNKSTCVRIISIHRHFQQQFFSYIMTTRLIGEESLYSSNKLIDGNVLWLGYWCSLSLSAAIFELYRESIRQTDEGQI